MHSILFKAKSQGFTWLIQIKFLGAPSQKQWKIPMTKYLECIVGGLRLLKITGVYCHSYFKQRWTVDIPPTSAGFLESRLWNVWDNSMRHGRKENPEMPDLPTLMRGFCNPFSTDHQVKQKNPLIFYLTRCCLRTSPQNIKDSSNWTLTPT